MLHSNVIFFFVKDISTYTKVKSLKIKISETICNNVPN